MIRDEPSPPQERNQLISGCSAPTCDADGGDRRHIGRAFWDARARDPTAQIGSSALGRDSALHANAAVSVRGAYPTRSVRVAGDLWGRSVGRFWRIDVGPTTVTASKAAPSSKSVPSRPAGWRTRVEGPSP